MLVEAPSLLPRFLPLFVVSGAYTLLMYHNLNFLAVLVCCFENYQRLIQTLDDGRAFNAMRDDQRSGRYAARHLLLT